MSSSNFGENWFLPGADPVIKGYFVEYDIIGTFCASYEADGVLRIPCVEVSDPSGGFSAYRIELQYQLPSWSFALDLNSIVLITL